MSKKQHYVVCEVCKRELFLIVKGAEVDLKIPTHGITVKSSSQRCEASNKSVNPEKIYTR